MAVLSNSCTSSLRREAVAGPVIAQRRRRIRGKVLFLAMNIHNTSYLMLLTCFVVFDQSELSTYKKLVVVLIYLRVKIVSSSLNILLLILVRRFPSSLLR